MVHSLTFAAVDLGRVSQSARSTSGLSNNLDFLLYGVLALAAIWAGWWGWSRLRARLQRSADSPESLFQELCRVHRLNRRERRLLRQAIAASRLAEPALAFVNPDSLLSMTQRSPADEGYYRALAEKLFGPGPGQA